MSTPATIEFDGITYFQEYDGYPFDVVSEMEEFVTEARQLAKNNPDFGFVRALTTILKEADYEHSECGGFPAQYCYKIDKDGNIFVLNLSNYFVQCRCEGDNLLITELDERERQWESWEDYEDNFTCDDCDEKKKYRMVDIDGTNLEERLICPKCGRE